MDADALRALLERTLAELEAVDHPLVLSGAGDGSTLAELADLAERCQDRLLDLLAGLTELRGQADAPEAP